MIYWNYARQACLRFGSLRLFTGNQERYASGGIMSRRWIRVRWLGSDGYPLLLLSEESLADLNRRLLEPLPMNRFRPNVVVRGGEAYAEDCWSRMRIGDLECSLVKACARCVTTTTDQVTAERKPEPLVTLASYRRVPRGVLFGQNLIHHTSGVLRVGHRVQVLATREIVELASEPGKDAAQV